MGSMGIMVNISRRPAGLVIGKRNVRSNQ
jgi:hypothetical protein